MGKRQHRIFARDIPRLLPGLINQEVNVLLKSGIVYYGYISQSSATALLLKDKLGKKHTIPVEQIAEVIQDKETPY